VFVRRWTLAVSASQEPSHVKHVADLDLCRGSDVAGTNLDASCDFRVPIAGGPRQ